MEDRSGTSLPSDRPSWVKVGQWVQVASRTWPGINKPGGVGRITALQTVTNSSGEPNYDGVPSEVRLQVRYILDGRQEKEIELKYVQPHEPTQQPRLRDRSLLLGRCQHCGSLRSDCGSCDLWMSRPDNNEHHHHHHPTSSNGITNTSIERSHRHVRHRQQQQPSVLELLEPPPDVQQYPAMDGEQHTSSSEDFESLWLDQKRRYRKYLRLKARAQQYLEDSSENEGDDVAPKECNRVEVIRPARGARPNEFRHGNSPAQLQRDQSVDNRSNSETDDTEDDDDDDDDDEIPLQQLVWQSSQVSPRAQSFLSRRPPGPLRRLEDDLSTSDTDQGATTHRRRRPHRRNSFVSNQGSIDDHSIKSLLNQDIGNDALHDRSPTEKDEDTHSCESVDDDSSFIQPEGVSAAVLPKDIVDQTELLNFAELGPFLDRTLQEIEGHALVKAEARFQELQQRALEAKTMDSWQQVARESQELHGELVQQLIQGGVDQCRLALRKLSDGRLYRKHRDLLPAESRDRRLEARSFHFEAVAEASETLLARLRALIVKFLRCIDEWQAPNNNDTDLDSEGWADPDAESLTSFVYRESIVREEKSTNFQLAGPHPYATKKKKDGLQYEEGKARKRQTPLSDNNESHRARIHRSFQPSEEEKARARSLRRRRSRTRRNDVHSKESRSNTGLDIDLTASNESVALDLEQDENHPEVSTEALRMFAASAATERAQQRPAMRNVDGKNSKRLRGVCPDDYHPKRKGKVNDHLPRNANWDELFVSLLRDEQLNSLDAADEGELCVVDEEYFCDAIRGSFPESQCMKFFQALSYKDTSALPVGGFQRLSKTMTDLILENGSPLLIDIICCEDKALDEYVALFKVLVTCFEKRLPGTSVANHEIAVETSQQNSATFLDWILLQLVDGVFAMVHPTAWAVKRDDQIGVLQRLQPLRDILKQHFHLVDRVCQCVLNELEVQRWRMVPERQTIFVSSLDPVEWKEFLATGSRRRAPQQVRHKEFPSFLPRCEVESLWLLLAYFASGKSDDTAPTGGFQWQLISQLLTRCSLQVDPESRLLPPSVAQLDAAAEDISKLTYLLLTGSLGTLPRQDTLMVEILKKATSLYCDSVRHDPSAYENAFPRNQNEKEERAWAEQLWQKSQSERSNNVRGKLKRSNFVEGLLSESLGHQSFVLPASRVVRSCLGFVVAWIDRLPSGLGSRHRRFDMAINALCKSLVCEASQFSRTTSSSEQMEPDNFGNSFTEVFGSGSAAKGMPDPDARGSLALRECAVYIILISAWASMAWRDESGEGTLFDVSKICTQIWDIVADDSMKERRAGTLSSEPAPIASNTAFLENDRFQLYLSTKVITCLGLSALGIPFWGDALVSTTNTSCLLITDSQSLESLLSYLITCLVCSFEQGIRARIRLSVIFCISLFMEKLQKTALSFTIEVKEALICIQDCITKLLKIPSLSHEDQVGFSMLLSAALEGVRVEFNNQARTIHGQTAPGIRPLAAEYDDNIWGGIDDVDFGLLSCDGTDPLHETSAWVFWNLLSKALEEATPSRRYIVGDSVGSSEWISSAGKLLVGRSVGILGAFLAEMIVLDPIICDRDGSTYRSLLNPWRRCILDDKDMEYKSFVGLTLTDEICKRAESHRNVRDLMVRDWFDALCTIIGEALALSCLEKIPTSNLSSIGFKHGQEMEEKCFAKLMRYVDKEQSHNAASKERLWHCCRRLGVILKDSEGCQGKIGKLLASFRPSSRLLPSIEQQCFDRLRITASVVLACAEHDPITKEFENLASFSLATMCRQSIYLIKALNIHSLASAGTDKETVQGVQFYEKSSCYSELMTSLLCCTIQACPSTVSSSFERLLMWVLERFITPIVRQHPIDLCSTFQAIIDLVNTLNDGVPTSHASQAPLQSHVIGSKIFLGILREAFLRHGRQWLLAVASAMSQDEVHPAFLGLLNSLVVSCIEEETPSLSQVRQWLGSDPVSDLESPMFVETNRFLAKLEKRYPPSPHELSGWIQCKRHILTVTLISYLMRQVTGCPARLKVLRMVGFLLEPATGSPSPGLLDGWTIGQLLRGTILSLRMALISENQVNQELIVEVYQTVGSILQLPAQVFCPDAPGNLLEFCRQSESTMAGDQARYVGSVAFFMDQLGLRICPASGSATEEVDSSLSAYVQALRNLDRTWSVSGEASGAWPREDQAAQAMEQWSHQVGGSAVSSTAVVVNVYAQRRRLGPRSETPAHDCTEPLGRMVPWRPSAKLRDTVQHFHQLVSSGT